MVPEHRISAGLEQVANGGGTACPDGSMQRSSAILVLGLNVGSGLEQNTDGFDLAFRIPFRAGDEAIRGIM